MKPIRRRRWVVHDAALGKLLAEADRVEELRGAERRGELSAAEIEELEARRAELRERLERWASAVEDELDDLNEGVRE